MGEINVIFNQGNVISTGQLSIHFLYLDTRGQLWNGEPCSTQCSPGLTICISLRETDSQLSCDTPGTQEPVIITQIYSHVNNITFGAHLGEVNNPIVYKTTDEFKVSKNNRKLATAVYNVCLQGVVYISIEVNNYNYPNSSYEAIDRVHIHYDTSAASNEILTYSGSRAANPTLTALEWRHSEAPAANHLGIANGGMGIFRSQCRQVLNVVLWNCLIRHSFG